MAATEERLVELWSNRRQAADELRKQYEDRWMQNWQWYRNKRTTESIPGQQWRSNRQLPDAFKVIETMVPQHVMGMFRNRDWFSVEAPTVPGETYQKVVKALLLQGWRKADAYRKTVEGIKMGNILGHFVPKTTWLVDVGEREVLDINYAFTADGERVPDGFKRRTVKDVRHNGPQITFPDLFNLWQDPTGRGLFWIERIPTSFEELKVRNDEFGGRLYKNLKKLGAHVSVRKLTGDYKTTPPIGFDHYTNTPPLAHTVDGIPEYAAADAVVLYQCWGYVSPEVKKYDDTQWRLQVIANDEVLIRDVPAPTHDHRPPYDNVQAIPIPGQIYGDSVLSYVGDLIDLRSEIENRRRDEVLLNMYPTHWVDGRFQVRGQDMLKVPGGAIRLMPNEPGLDPARAFGTVPRSPVMPESYQESAVKEQQILTASGATEPFQGTAFGGRTTATEVNLIANIGQSRFQLATMWMDESFKKPVLERMFGLYQSRLTQEEALQLAGEPDLQGGIDFNDLSQDVDIWVDSGMFGSMDAQQAQQMMQLYSAMMANPETAQWINPGRFVKAMSYRMGIDGSDDFVRSEDEMAAMAAQQQQAAERMAAIEAAAQGVQPN